MNSNIDKIRSTILKYLERFDSKKIEELENNLNINSIISLIYLLFDDRKEALNYLTVDKCNSKIITKWCRERNNGEWKLRIVESLLLMQNYKCLKILGYNKRDLNEVKQYLNWAHRSCKFDKRKIFYSIFDTLTIDELDEVIKYIDKNDDAHQEQGLFKLEFIEVYLLRWEENNSIRLHLNGLISLQLIFQELNLYHGLNAIDFYRTYWPEEDDEILDNVQGTNVKEIDGRMSDCSELLSSQLPYDEVGDIYKIINPNRVGICIIVNQENYDDSSKHSPRHGSKCDIGKLYETMNMMNIKSYKLTDLKHNEIFPSIEAKIRECFNPNIHSVLFVVIMAHGQKGSIFGTDGIAVDTDLIRDSLSDDKCPILKGKPKIIIFQCCRGEYHYGSSSNFVADGPEEKVNQNFKTSMEDYIMCWSTLPGFKSYRSKIDGSLYIQTLCECLELGYTKDHVPKILTQVHKVFNEQKQIHYNKEIVMVPEFNSALTKDLYLVQQ